MNYLDIILIILLGLGLIRGFTNGLVRELTSLAALILGIFGAIKFSDLTSSLLIEHFNLSGNYLPVLSFAITFVVIIIAVHFVGDMLDKFSKIPVLSMVNRLAGMVFGLLKTALIVSILLVILGALDKRAGFLPKDKIADSFLYEPVYNLAPFIFHNFHFDEYRFPGEKKEKSKSFQI
jgi:membrane protein required for colicin V production